MVRIGYFGHLSEAWFDWPALIRIARSRPGYRFEIIGHSAPSGLDLPQNVSLLGPKPWSRLRGYASRWHAAMIPFRMGVLADGVDPIKVYEYLAFGIPVVSFRMPQISDYPHVATVADVKSFCEALDEACQIEVDMELIKQFVKRKTWDVRLGELLSLADELASC